MADLIALAKQRRARLAAGVARLDAFLRTAEALAAGVGDGDLMELDLEAAPRGASALAEALDDYDAAVSPLIGKMIRHRRWMMGITAEELSNLTGFPPAEIDDYERGLRPVGAEGLRRIAVATNVPVSFFLQEVDPGRRPAAALFDEEMLDGIAPER